MECKAKSIAVCHLQKANAPRAEQNTPPTHFNSGPLLRPFCQHISIQTYEKKYVGMTLQRQRQWYSRGMTAETFGGRIHRLTKEGPE